MNTRVFLSLNLAALAILLVVVPANKSKKDQPTPVQQVNQLNSNNNINVDLAARYVNDSDSGFQFIDLRTPDEFLVCNIPGSINIPYEQLLDIKWQGYLNQTNKINILYANGDLKSNMALTLLNGKGYKNNSVLNGGLNEWFAVVMNTEFTGGRLTARENAVYENRRKAKNLFTEINSLPDSLKTTFLEAKIIEEAELDGGCE
ncbi:MAG: rhodanese-like domain-containing protein [Bacteroidales bacterium]|nr:rhodanese-like domain-containing protein [Bacteroidales bacterium]